MALITQQTYQINRNKYYNKNTFLHGGPLPEVPDPVVGRARNLTVLGILQTQDVSCSPKGFCSLFSSYLKISKITCLNVMTRHRNFNNTVKM